MEGTFCSAPYIASYIGTQGEFMPCCIFNQEHKLSTYSGDDDLLDHMNSPAAVQLRKDLHNGIKVKGCDHCWELEEKGIESLRYNFNRVYDSSDWSPLHRSELIRKYEALTGIKHSVT